MQSLKDFARAEFATHSAMILDDLNAMTDEQLARSHGGCSRTGFDIAYEVAFHNGRLLAVLKGEDPASFSFADGWISAPDHFKTKDSLLTHLKETNESVLAAFDSASDDHLESQPAELPAGRISLLNSVAFHAKHMLYHDAQLNFCQTLDNDPAVHWNF